MNRAWLALSCVLLFARSSRADVASSIAAGAAAGAAAGIVASGPRPDPARRGSELTDWRDSGLAMAGRLAAGCGVAVELRLTGTGAANFLDVTITNQNDFPLSLAVRQVIAQFGSGRSRYLDLDDRWDGELAAGWWQQVFFRFPEKADFAGQDTLRVGLPFVAPGKPPCVVSVELNRPRGVPLRERTYTEFTQFQIDFGLSMHFAATGDLSKIARNVNPGFELGFIGFPWVHHGISLDFGIDGYGRRGLPAVVPGHDANPVLGLYAMAGYVFRLVPTRRLSLSYAPAFGAYNVGVTEGSDKSSTTIASETCLALRQRLRLSYFVGMLDDARFEIAPAIQHTYLPFGKLGAADVGGNLFSGLLFLTLSQ